MLIGYVSDERYIALTGVDVELTAAGAAVAVRSTASGAIYADVAPGQYQVTLAKDGYGAKKTTVQVGRGIVNQFRLLTDGLLGYAWPKWVTSGEKSEFRVHSDEAGIASGCADLAGTTSTGRGRRCRSRPTATTRKPA
jgi:hypothetical protein